MANDAPQPTTAPAHEETTPITLLVGGALALIVLIGIIVRVPGWQGGGLYYDDAWLALPARVPFSTAMHMIVTAPGYTMLQAGWITLNPSSNRWALLLPLILGCVAPVAVFVMGRASRLPSWVCLVFAAMVAAEPVAIEYATRVKTYEAELVVSALLLAGTEVVRRHRRTRGVLLLGVASVAAIVMSTTLLPIVAGIWIALVALAILDGRNRRAIIITAVVAGLNSVPVLAWIIAKVPPALTAFWVGNDRLPGAPLTVSHLLRTFGVSAGGLLHGLLGTPMWQPAGGVGSLHGTQVLVLLGLLILEVVVVLVLCLPTLRALWGRDVMSPTLSLLPAVVAVLIAILEYLTGLVPLGTGRTDLLLVPPILLLVGGGLVRAAAWISVRTSPARSTRIGLALAVVAAVVGTSLAWHQRGWYPVQAVRSLDAKMASATPPGPAATVVTYRNSFTWAFERLSPFTVHFSKTATAASTIGYWVTFNDPRVLVQLPGSLAGPGAIPGLGALAGIQSLWLVGTTAGTFQPSTVHLTGPAAGVPVATGADAELRRFGWVPTGTIERAPGAVASLYRRASSASAG